MKAIVNGIVYTPIEAVRDGVLLVDDSTIHWVGTRTARSIPLDAELIDAHGKMVVPGLIDLHTYGCLGVSMTAPERIADELSAFALNVAHFGVTRFLISPTMGDRAFIARILAALGENIPRVSGGALPVGVHLEGPWLDPEQRGAFPPEVLHAPSVEEARGYLDAARGYLRVVTLAPNLPNASDTASFLRENGVLVSLGHSNAEYGLAQVALRSGAYPLVTHTFNAMSGLHHRKPGVLGAVLSSVGITGMLICDGIHVHPAAVQVLFRSMGTDRVVLVTDSIPGGGMTEGTFTMLNQTARIVDGVARLQDGTIAGSILTLNRAVLNARDFGGLSFNDALKMATLNPARALGLKRVGLLEAGRDADIVIMDPSGQVALTMIKGKIVYQR